ncbi:MAG: hypothetical protein K6T65_09185 [Peptococcaceae bacterium]|nr:hypothetical protein [Peptococcaceae bacterium]
MKKLKFNAVHTRKKHDQCERCAYYIRAPYATGGGRYIFEFCTAKGHKGIIIQYKEKTERMCFDFMESERNYGNKGKESGNSNISTSRRKKAFR